MYHKINYTPEMIMTVIGHFHNHTNQDLANAIGVSSRTVSHIAAKYRLTKDPGHNSTIQKGRPREYYQPMIDKRNKNIQRDQRRLMLGLEPIYNLHYSGTTRQEWRYRSRMKSVGYVVFRFDPIIYYDTTTRRRPKAEAFGKSLGLLFLPISMRGKKIPEPM